MGIIASVRTLELLDSRGNPTVEACVRLTSGAEGSFLVPSGASVGTHEALELRDVNASRYRGKGVAKVLSSFLDEIGSLVPKLGEVDQRSLDQAMIDLDGTPNKSRLGANAILSVSLAFARAQAMEREIPLYQHIADLCGENDTRMPVPMINILNGGAHANNNLDIQEFMIVPVGFSDIASAVRCAAEIFQSLKVSLSEARHSTAVGDEGGFAPNLKSDREALDFLVHAVGEAGYQIGSEVMLALDCAATEYFHHGQYQLEGQGLSYNGADYCNYLKDLVREYPICSLEDGVAESDWSSWKLLSDSLRSEVQLVGDDVFVTNPKFLQRGINEGIANAILVKVNQIGTLTESLDVIQMAKDAGYNTVVSHRSGDTEDSFIADLAVGTGAGQIKTGSMCRSERTSKYNQLLRIQAQQGHMDFRGLEEIQNHKECEDPCGYSSA